MSEKRILVVMPSHKNEAMKDTALKSIVNNTELKIDIFKFPDNKNRGWMSSCNLGLEKAKEYEYIILANDDIIVPPVCDWAKSMVMVMDLNPGIGALSALSWFVMGWAKLNEQTALLKQPYQVPYCSFFFVMLRSEAVQRIGLLDESLPGGDDLDYCLRLKERGYAIAINPQVFVWHHYAQTGKKEFGNYWDSEEHTEKINQALINKHGYRKFVYNQYLEGGK